VDARGRSNLLIVGSNGVGKSAVARVLGGLWQPKAGKVGRPLSLIVIPPQLPLVPTLALSLLDTMTYPLQLKHGSAEESDAIVTLLPLLQKLRIGYLIDRSSDGWYTVSAWDTVGTPANQSTLLLHKKCLHLS
jgi:ATP-binding cassette subfamily D (ALD) long-chain fatty acid import protein